MSNDANEANNSTVTTQTEKGSESNETRDVIFIGKKPLMAYVTSTLIQLANIPSVTIKARGMSIGRAVDVSQIISRKTENAGYTCLLYTSPSPRDQRGSRMPSSA